jgi:hypothetical protein
LLFGDVQKIFERAVASYCDSLNLPEYILNKISFDKNKYNISVKIFGFNSKKFDINIFVNHITDSFIHIKSVIGTETQYKFFTLRHDKYSFQIQFLELKSFLAEGYLDKYVIKFTRIQKKQKGLFPYELLNTQNYRNRKKRKNIQNNYNKLFNKSFPWIL